MFLRMGFPRVATMQCSVTERNGDPRPPFPLCQVKTVFGVNPHAATHRYASAPFEFKCHNQRTQSSVTMFGFHLAMMSSSDIVGYGNEKLTGQGGSDTMTSKGPV